MSYKYLDLTGLSHFWDKIKAKIPTKTSQLTNDSGFVNSSGNVATATTLQTYLYNRSDATNIWVKIATTTITKKASQWEEKHAFLFIKGTHNSNYNQNGIIAIDATGNGQSGIVGSYNAQFMTATKDIDLSNFYIEYLNGDSETDGVVNFWVKIATNRYASWQVKILQNNGWTIKGATATTTAMPTTGYTGKNAVLSGNSLKATQDSDGNQINTTYYKASNPNGYTSNTGTITGIKMNGASKGTSGVVDLGTVITAHQDISGKQNKLTAGSNIQISSDNTISATDTTYSSKTAASGGTDVSLVTTGEKYTWNNKTSNTGTVTSVAVKMNNTTKGTVTTSGTIDLGTVITAHQDISGKQDKLTSQTAYTAKGTSKKVPQITTNSLGQVTGITEVTITQPTVNNGTLTIQKNGTSVGTFTANQSGNSTANITVPTKTTDLTNDSGFIESEDETVANIVSLTKEEYDALDTKTPNTLYNIIDDYDDNVPTAILDNAFTIGTGTLETNHSYKNGKAVTLNFSIRTSTTAGRTLVLLTLPSGLYPTNAAVGCFATVNGTLANSWIRNQNGDVCVVTPATLTNIEIKLITTYIV